MKNGTILSSVVGIAWFAVWLVCGALVLQWAFEHKRELFEFLLPVFFIAWIASLYIGRAALAAVTKRLLGLHDAHGQTHATSVSHAHAELIDHLTSAYFKQGALNRIHRLKATEKEERQENSASSEVNIELTDFGSYACSLTIYVSQQDWRHRLEASRFLKTAQEAYKEYPTKESLSQAWQHEE